MLLALGTAAIVLVALLWELARPRLLRALESRRLRGGAHAIGAVEAGYDPGRERRAEQRARALLRSCIDHEDWAMYRDLGFIRVWGGLGEGMRTHRSPAAPGPQGSAARSGGFAAAHSGGSAARPGGSAAHPGGSAARPGGSAAPSPRGAATGGSDPGSSPAARARHARAPYAYLIYPHRPIVAYLPQSGRLLNEYCVAFPDHSRPYGSARLPDSDDVLAKWMALTADERRLIADANMHLPGRQIDPERVRRDLVRLSRWERERLGHSADNVRAA